MMQNLQNKSKKWPNTKKLQKLQKPKCKKSQIKRSKKKPNTKNAKYKRNAKLAYTNGRKSDLVRRPLCKQLDPKVFCEALGQVAHSVVSCLYQRSDPIIQPYLKTKRVNDDVANAAIGRHHTRQRFGGV